MFLTLVSVLCALHWSSRTRCTRALTTANQSYTSACPFLFFFFAEGGRSVKQEAPVWTTYFIVFNWFIYFQDSTAQYLLIHDMQIFLSLSAIIKLNILFLLFDIVTENDMILILFSCNQFILHWVFTNR